MGRQRAVWLNLEFTIALRNKIEHRYEEAISIAVAGYAQALLLNFEEELIQVFGRSHALGNQLRFPIFVGTFTKEGMASERLPCSNSCPRRPGGLSPSSSHRSTQRSWTTNTMSSEST